MWCPECRAEYREGFTHCADCGVELVVSEPPPEGHPEVELVTVFRTGEADLLPLVKSLLEESEIPYTIRGEELVGMFPSAGVGLAIDPRSRAAEVQVTSDRADEVRELLAEVEQGYRGGDPDED